ncbi:MULTISPECIES: carbon storage regulator [Clostridia]|uniref:Translational regulator CsrA n=1 Tax=Lacrimispora xylanolytica TaxID=29375 RepID=A0ABY7AFY0_9FIRM|nr:MULTISPECIES: carbon storage regulator [Clostridia]MBS5955911.1 carbon storage regulator [Clostridiales bacterium]WAJ24734.1 carbon storage regulator [Lacrimispora xylanolytica]
MLILQRKKGQELKIGDNICITVLDMGNDWVKLAIDAPRDVSILRSELIEAASANKEAAAVSLSPGSISKINELLKIKKDSGDN